MPRNPEGCSEKWVTAKGSRPADVPQHLMNIFFQINITNNFNIVNNFGRLRLNANPATKVLGSSAKASGNTFEDFMLASYRVGGMMSLKVLKRNPGWKAEYEDNLTIKRIHMCKSCGSRAFSGCCSGYSTKNRKQMMMVLEWSEK